MNLINAMVKNGQFTTQLANVIFTLCAQLKTSGINLEQTHRNELNKVFVSLRQACCRDNGQLGTPCRVQLMRTAIALYLINAVTQSLEKVDSVMDIVESTAKTSVLQDIYRWNKYQLKIMELVELRAMHWRSNLAHSQYYLNRPEQQHEQVLPTQQMTFLPHSPLFVPTDTPQSPHPANASFYLIPASSGWIPPMIPGIPPNPFIPQPLIAPETVLMRQRSMKKAKTMLRHEMIIRNSDSGKIMGVKGRRVALVEQMTNTVISFQKVDPKSKERTLTITASSMEDIERAKDLIIDTIKRNMSPIRVDRIVNDKQEDEDENENDISIETTQDGMLKLCCSDPEVLQAAQEALSEYLRSRARPSAEEREKRKERRKSMPLQANQSSSSSKNNRSIHGSTPNLAETVVEAEAQQATTGNPETFKPTYCYDRTTLLKFRENTNDIVDEVRTRIADVATEILR